jgi:hypothetical protein
MLVQPSDFPRLCSATLVPRPRCGSGHWVSRNAADGDGGVCWLITRLRYEAGAYAEVADRLRVLVDASPQYALFRDSAKDDSDLDVIRDEPAFKRLVSK